MASNINPPLKPTSSIADFRFWCQKVLPLVYDDSLSYYEVLGKMVIKINEMVETVNNDADNVITLKDAFLELQTYVNNFFDDIDQLASYAERAEAAQTSANTSAVNAATSASNASQSSLAAMDARDTAVAARQAAQTSANNASTAATNANTKANEAAQSAITAQTAQASASQSATLAATDRSAAQTAANTATTKANEANTSATNAETSAENAAQSESNAEELVNNIQENLDNIQQNTQDISNLKESITPFVEEVPYINLFDGNFDESGFYDHGVPKSNSSFKRTSKYYPIVGDNKGLIYGYTSEQQSPFSIEIYDGSKNFIKAYGFLSGKTTGSLSILANAKYFRLYTRADYAGNCTIALTPLNSYVPYQLVHEIKDKVIHAKNLDDELQNKIGVESSDYMYVNGVLTDVLKGLYIPNITGWSFYRIRCRSTMFRFGITLPDGTKILNGLNDVGTAYSDTVQKLVNPNTGEVIGYYVLHYIGEDYDEDASASASITPNTEYTSSLDYNPIIKEYLSREENLVLMGDSIFGYADANQLAPLLSKISNKQVFNCGFGGCTMAKRPNAQAYYPFTFAGIAESIASGNFSAQQAAISLQVAAYPYRYADLVSVDWSKPTTIFVDYINNDFTLNIPLGDPWEYTDAPTDWDNTKFVEAMTYGLNKILTEYPHIRVVFFTSKWRFIANGSNVLQPPYVYENSLNLKAKDYNDALIENANRLGVSVYDFHNWGGANAFNASYYMIDGKSHFTIEGYEHFAEVLNNLDKSFIG